MNRPPDPDYDDEDGPPSPPDPPVIDPTPVRRNVARKPLPFRVPQYKPPEDPNEQKARYHISEIPGYNGLADEDGEPIWDGYQGDGVIQKGPLSR